MNDSSDTTDDFFKSLRQRASRMLPSELAVRMGYRRIDEQLLQRIESVLGDQWLGLKCGGFDFRYTAPQFVEALTSALGLDSDVARAEVEQLRVKIRNRQFGFQPFIFVDTGFERANQPVFAMAAMESKRHLTFEESFIDLALHEQVRIVQTRVQTHYSENAGEIPFWGGIWRYLFYYDSHNAVALRPDGSLVEDMQKSADPTAKLSINGANLFPGKII